MIQDDVSKPFYAMQVLQVLTEEARRGGCISPLHSCRPTVEAAINSLRYTLLPMMGAQSFGGNLTTSSHSA